MSTKKSYPQTPENYIKTGNARKLPIYECWVNEDFQTSGMANVLVSRIHKNGNLTGAIYLIDLFCLGVKDSVYFFNSDAGEYKEEILTAIPERIKIDYNHAHNLIYGAEIYAEELGLSAHKSFKTSQYILEEDTDDIPLEYFEFGENGKPHLFVSKNESRNLEIKLMENKLGKDGFHVTYQDLEFSEEDACEDTDEEDDEEEDVEEVLHKINDNDFLYYLEINDLDVIENIVNIYERCESPEKHALELEKLISDFEEPPLFILHRNTDEIYTECYPSHDNEVKAFKPLLPEETSLLLSTDYPEGTLAMAEFFDDLVLENDEETSDYETMINAAIHKLREKHGGKEALESFLVEFYFEEDDDENIEKALENYINLFPNSLHAQAVYLNDKIHTLVDKSQDALKKIMNILPFKIVETNTFFPNTTKAIHISEILSFLFLQGIYHIANHNIVKAEAFLREMVDLRLKEYPYFGTLRILLTQEKIHLFPKEKPKNSNLKIVL